MSSVGSCASYVSFRGDDGVDLNECLDELYRDIQSNLNDSQCSVRTMARLKEDDDFKECQVRAATPGASRDHPSRRHPR